MRADRGFTLIEVMVALVVVALALPALIITLYTQVDGTGYLRDKSMAQWVASNKLVETRLQVASNGAIFKGSRSGSSTMAQREWYWWLKSETTAVADFYRVTIAVATAEEDEDQPLVTLTGFLAADKLEEQ